jgi:malate dehydrogenase (oxaloacetate-decarboxylating)
MSQDLQAATTPDAAPILTGLTGYDLLNNPRLNKGTAFTVEERDAFDLHGLLPPHVGTLDEQMARRMKAFGSQPNGFAKYRFLRDLQDTNETLFYALITHNIEMMLPIVYTPVVGEGCQRFSEIWRKPRGLFISYPNKDRIPQILSYFRSSDVKAIVVSDGERILGLGDQGAGGMGIPIGKMALYTALGGIHPEHCLPVLLDVGTDNEKLLNDPLYIGWRHQRVRGQEYNDFIGAFVAGVQQHWPHVLLQWEDFAGSNAARLLDKYRNDLCTFNDDIQGTAAIATATLLAAANATGTALKDQKIAVFGFGSAGIGIANMLLASMKSDGASDAEAHQHLYAIDRYGLIVEGTQNIRAAQLPFMHKKAVLDGWHITGQDEVGLLDVVRNAKPTVLIGVSAQQGAFTEEVVREMAKHTEHPIIFPLSNPTSSCEATPQQLLDWTDGRAIVGTGSPFPPAQVMGNLVHTNQVNNSYIFPGLALGIVASQARHVSDAMIMAAAKALAELSPTKKDKKANLLPPLADARQISWSVAKAVGLQAMAEGLAGVADEKALLQEIKANVWEPVYVPYIKERQDTWPCSQMADPRFIGAANLVGTALDDTSKDRGTGGPENSSGPESTRSQVSFEATATMVGSI